MRIAVPVTAGKLSAHFGHCEQLAIIDVAVGAPENERHQLVLQYLAGQLEYGQNICDH